MPWVASSIYGFKLSPASFSSDFMTCDLLQHTLNLVIITIDLFICKSPLPLFSCTYPVILGLFYVFWTWIFVYSNIWGWPYTFFDLVFNPKDRPLWLTIAALFCGMIGLLVNFWIVYILVKIRDHVGISLSQSFKKSFKKSVNLSCMIGDDSITYNDDSFKNHIFLN